MGLAKQLHRIRRNREEPDWETTFEFRRESRSPSVHANAFTRKNILHIFYKGSSNSNFNNRIDPYFKGDGPESPWMRIGEYDITKSCYYIYILDSMEEYFKIKYNTTRYSIKNIEELKENMDDNGFDSFVNYWYSISDYLK